MTSIRQFYTKQKVSVTEGLGFPIQQFGNSGTLWVVGNSAGALVSGNLAMTSMLLVSCWVRRLRIMMKSATPKARTTRIPIPRPAPRPTLLLLFVDAIGGGINDVLLEGGKAVVLEGSRPVVLLIVGSLGGVEGILGESEDVLRALIGELAGKVASEMKTPWFWLQHVKFASSVFRGQ